MLNSKEIGIFDPRTKLVLALFYAVAVTAENGISPLTAELGALLCFIIFIGQAKAYLRWLRLVVPMSLFFGAVTWWSANLNAGIFAALKLLTLTTVFFGFFSVTTPEDLGNALVKSGLPYPVAFVMSTSLQLVPILTRKAKNVLNAQRARGIPMEAGWKVLKHYPAFLVPLLIQAFQFAEELAEAMEARGFGRTGRTFLKEYRLQTKDWLAVGVGFGILLICILL